MFLGNLRQILILHTHTVIGDGQLNLVADLFHAQHDTEGNYTGQLGGLIREHTGHAVDHKLLKYDGRPIYPEEIYHKALEVVRG